MNKEDSVCSFKEAYAKISYAGHCRHHYRLKKMMYNLH